MSEAIDTLGKDKKGGVGEFIRETREETGYIVEVVRLVGVYSDPKFTTMTYPDGNTVSYVALAFECKLVGGSPELRDESSAVELFDPQQLPENFHPGHVPRLHDALAKHDAAFYR